MVRREIRIAKRTYWRELCYSIGEEIEINELWGIIREMGGIQRRNIPVFINNNKAAETDSDEAEMLVESSVKVHSNDMRKYREQQYTDIKETSRRHIRLWFDTVRDEESTGGD